MSKQADKTNKPAPPKAAKPTPQKIQQTPVDSHLLQLAREDPARLTPAQRSQLQRTLGNRALSQWVCNPSSVNGNQSNLQSPVSNLPVQPKLTVNAVGDKYEQEADAVAKEVVQKLNTPQHEAAAGVPTAPPHAQRQTEEDEPIAKRIQRQETPRSAVAGVPTAPPTLQRQLPDEEDLQLQRQETEDEELQLQRQELDEEEPQETAMLQRQTAPEEEELQLQRQEMPNEEEMQLQRQALEEEDPEQMAMTQRQPQDFTQGGPVDSHIEAQINQTRGGGRPMEDSIRQPMEQAFGADFSDVRIHTDAQAHNLNQAVQARAFTTNNDIFFKRGEFNQGSLASQELLAHELTHSIQQSNTNLSRKENEQNEEIFVEGDKYGFTISNAMGRLGDYNRVAKDCSDSFALVLEKSGEHFQKYANERVDQLEQKITVYDLLNPVLKIAENALTLYAPAKVISPLGKIAVKTFAKKIFSEIEQELKPYLDNSKDIDSLKKSIEATKSGLDKGALAIVMRQDDVQKKISRLQEKVREDTPLSDSDFLVYDVYYSTDEELRILVEENEGLPSSNFEDLYTEFYTKLIENFEYLYLQATATWADQIDNTIGVMFGDEELTFDYKAKKNAKLGKKKHLLEIKKALKKIQGANK